MLLRKISGDGSTGYCSLMMTIRRSHHHVSLTAIRNRGLAKLNDDADYEYEAQESSGGDAAAAELERYGVHLRREMSFSLRQELEARLNDMSDNAEGTLRSELPIIFRDLQIRNFQEYIQQRRAASSAPMSGEAGQWSHDGADRSHEDSRAGVLDNAMLVDDDIAGESASANVPWEFAAFGTDLDLWFDSFDGMMFNMPTLLPAASDSGFVSTASDGEHKVPHVRHWRRQQGPGNR